MFSIGDQIVHPMHGAGVIENIVEQKVDGEPVVYYALKLILDDVILFIPVQKSDEIGIRSICSGEDAASLLENISGIDEDEDQSWNRRYRENMLRIRSGNMQEVAKVVKNLVCREQARGLSTGEKKMLHSAQRILISELALALQKKPSKMEEILNMRLCL